MKVKSTIIFSKNPFKVRDRQSLQTEENKVSFWLKKLYDQGQRNKKINTSEDSLTSVNILQHKIEKTHIAEDKGLDQYAADQKVKIESDKHIVEELVKQSNRRLISISSTFPFTLFPNTIDVEENRITFNFRQFLAYQSHSIDIKDITNVFIEAGIFFASLQVVSRTFTENEVKIDYLKKDQAVQVRKIIEGLRTLKTNDIDTSSYEIGELLNKLLELNMSDHIK